MTLRERALALCGKQLSDPQILSRLAEDGYLIDARTLRRWRNDAGIAAYHPPISPERIAACVAAYRLHKSVHAAARVLKMDVRTVAKRLAEAGLTHGENDRCGA